MELCFLPSRGELVAFETNTTMTAPPSSMPRGGGCGGYLVSPLLPPLVPFALHLTLLCSPRPEHVPTFEHPPLFHTPVFPFSHAPLAATRSLMEVREFDVDVEIGNGTVIPCTKMWTKTEASEWLPCSD